MRGKHEGTIRQRVNGVWEGRVQLLGQHYWVYGRSRAEVLGLLATLRGRAPTARPATLGELVDRYLETAGPTLKARTLHDYSRVLEQVRATFGDRTRLDRITPSAVQAYYSRFPSVRQAAKAHTTLHRLFRLGVLWRAMPDNPCDRVVRPAYRPARRSAWTVDQVRRFLASARRWRPLWLTIAGCGLRIGEARALQWGDLDGALLTVARSIGLVGGRDVVGRPKSAASGRVIVVPGIVLAALDEWRVQQAAERERLGLADLDGWVWTSERGGLVAYHSVRKAFVSDRARAGLAGTIHDLRHSHASILLAAGLPLPEISRRLGHASPAITSSIYAHAIRPDERAAAVVEAALTEGE